LVPVDVVFGLVYMASNAIIWIIVFDVSAVFSQSFINVPFGFANVLTGTTFTWDAVHKFVLIMELGWLGIGSGFGFEQVVNVSHFSVVAVDCSLFVDNLANVLTDAWCKGKKCHGLSCFGLAGVGRYGFGGFRHGFLNEFGGIAQFGKFIN
jgi:hypothetical protein